MAQWVPKPLFIIHNYDHNGSSPVMVGEDSNDYNLVAVTGASGAKSLSFSIEGDCLFVATDTCVLQVTEDGLKVRAIAGSCTETGSRNGPLMFARFTSLVSISSVVDSGRFFIALLDSGGRNNLLLADSWSVSEVCKVQEGALDLSMSAIPLATIGGGFKEIAILVLSPLSAFLILGKNDVGPEKVMFASALLWKTYNIFSLNSSTQAAEANWGSETRFTACLLQVTATDVATGYTAYLIDTEGSLWTMIVAGNDVTWAGSTTNIYRKTIIEWNNNNRDLTSFFFSKLSLWGSCGNADSSTSTCRLWALDTLNSRFIDVFFYDNDHNDWFVPLNNNNSANNYSCIFPWQKSIFCEYGHLWIPQENVCAPSPPGGYVDRSTVFGLWIPCPVGTYNPLPMAVSSLACKRCDAGTIAPFTGSVVCTFCNDTHPLQSTSGSECLSTCLTATEYNNNNEGGGGGVSLVCKSCPPGSEPTKEKGAATQCRLCPDNFYSSTWDEPCSRCPPNFTSVEGATYCSVQCPPETCSPDGFSSCVFSSFSTSAYMVYTVADFKNSAANLLSMAVCSNGTIFLGNDAGYLIIFHGEGGVGDGLVFSVDMAYLGVKTLNALTLSRDAGTLFVADTLEGLIVKTSGTGSQMEIMLPRSSQIMPTSLCFVDSEGLYAVDAKNYSLIWLAPEPVKIQNAPWPGLIFATPHESGHDGGVVCLVKNSNIDSEEFSHSIWHVRLSAGGGHKSTLLSFVFKTYTSLSSSLLLLSLNTIVTIRPWISRWKNGKTAICIDDTVIALISDGNSSDFTVAVKANDGAVISPIAASLQNHHNDENSKGDKKLLFLLEDQTFSIQVVFSRSCECAPNFYMKLSPVEACVPCPPHTYSMAGARGCSVCPSGEYMGLDGLCTVCPLTLWWWWDDAISAVYNPCRQMQTSLSTSSVRGVSLTILEAQELADTSNKNNYISVQDLDIISNATILLTGIDGDLAVPPPDIWIKGDLLGRLWSLQNRVTPKPFDPQGIAILNHPGIWALCSQIVLPGEPCTCRHGALDLGKKNSVWGRARIEAVVENVPGFSFTSVFVLRPDDNYMTAPILVNNGGASPVSSLLPQFPIGDMGVCFVGWPAQFNCSDPHYYWTFPSEIYPGGACLPCPPDTIAPAQSSVACRAITNENPLCKPGSFKTMRIQDFSYTCKLCEENTYSSTQGAIQCLRKKVLSCPQGFYINDGGHTSDNTCVQCVPCAENSMMIPFLVDPCPGNTQAQPYVCMAWLQSIPGFSVSFFNPAISSSSSSLSVSPSLRYIPCAGLPPFAIWGTGPQREICFFRCKFGVNELAVKEYAFYWALLSPENSVWVSGDFKTTNLFPYAVVSHLQMQQRQSSSFTLAINAMSEVCTPCNTSACPEGMWRPLWNDGCGPPCHLSPFLCQGRTDGCVPICNVPENAAVRSYDTVDQDGRALCFWICNIGFIKIGETCSACNASLCQPGESYIGNSQCSPEMSLAQICLPCPATVRGGVLNLAAPDRGKCSYTCLEDFYYSNPNPLIQSNQMASVCVQCAGTVTRCPAGYSVTCAVNPCKLCQTQQSLLLLSGKAVMVPTSDSVCRVQCVSGFHTISIFDRTVLSDKNKISSGYDPSEILCEECSRRPFIACPVLSCSPGYQIGGINNDVCIPCKTSAEMGCLEGTYAPPCPGGRVTQIIGCLSCPMYDLLVAAGIQDSVPDQWPTRMFVSSSSPFSSYYYSGSQFVIIPVNNSGQANNNNNYNNVDCLTACVDGSVQVKTSTTTLACVACSLLLPTPSKNAPYIRYYSTWNATPGLRWWPAAFDPPHLQKRPLDSRGNLRVESRAGLCWPCPHPYYYYYTTTLGELSSGDPCFSVVAPNNNNNNNNINSNLLPSSSDLSVIDNSNQQPDFAWVLNANNRRRRRLLFAFSTSADSTTAISSTAQTSGLKSIYPLTQVVCKKGQFLVPPLFTWCATCPAGHYCTGEKSQPVRCPPFFSAATGSTSSQNCSCRPGFVLASSSKKCVRQVSDLDLPCPRGFYKVTDIVGAKGQPQSTTCLPCPPGTREKNGRCHDCPLQSTSNEGSKVCICGGNNNNGDGGDDNNNNDNGGGGSRNNNAMTLVTTTGACPSGDCPQGSSLDFTDSKCKMCSHKMALPIPSVFPLTCSCGPGSYIDSTSKIIQCLPCPRGTFSQFAGDAPCTPCPEGTITLLQGSTTLTACVKSAILDPDIAVRGGNHSNANLSKIDK